MSDFKKDKWNCITNKGNFVYIDYDSSSFPEGDYYGCINPNDCELYNAENFKYTIAINYLPGRHWGRSNLNGMHAYYSILDTDMFGYYGLKIGNDGIQIDKIYSDILSIYERGEKDRTEMYKKIDEKVKDSDENKSIKKEVSESIINEWNSWNVLRDNLRNYCKVISVGDKCKTINIFSEGAGIINDNFDDKKIKNPDNLSNIPDISGVCKLSGYDIDKVDNFREKIIPELKRMFGKEYDNVIDILGIVGIGPFVKKYYENTKIKVNVIPCTASYHVPYYDVDTNLIPTTCSLWKLDNIGYRLIKEGTNSSIEMLENLFGHITRDIDVLNFIGKYFKENPNTEKTCNFITFGASHNFEQYNNENVKFINMFPISEKSKTKEERIKELSKFADENLLAEIIDKISDKKE